MPQSRAIARQDFEAIIRRAAELTLAESDTGEQLTEDEVLRIAAELGLPAHHVRQALYEQPTLAAPERWHERWFGPATLTEGRTVPGRPELLQSRIEEYLASREYLQIVRRRPSEITFIPADDPISRVARVFARPSSRFGLAHAERVVVAVHALPEQRTHVRVESDFSAERDRSARTGVGTGVFGGLVAGGALAAAAVLATTGPAEGVLAGLGMIAGMAGGISAGVRYHAARFRDRLDRVRGEIAHLLDRVETGQSLEPPPSPWRRNLQAKLFGPRR